MDEDGSSMEARIWALETLVAFLFAAQHMQTPDPAAAVARLRAQLIERAGDEVLPGDHIRREAALAELDRAVGRILGLQERLPRRLVD